VNRKEREEFRVDVLVLAHDAAMLFAIIGTCGVLLLLGFGFAEPVLVLLAPILLVLVILPLVVLRAHQPSQAPGPWPADVTGRRVGRWWDMLGINQTKQRAALTGVPDAPAPHRIVIGRNDPCPCGSGEAFKVCCAHRGWRHFWWEHGGKPGLYEG
jgi:hypothetical protein